jgi:hypothetical protein
MSHGTTLPATGPWNEHICNVLKSNPYSSGLLFCSTKSNPPFAIRQSNSSATKCSSVTWSSVKSYPYSSANLGPAMLHMKSNHYSSLLPCECSAIGYSSGTSCRRFITLQLLFTVSPGSPRHITVPAKLCPNALLPHP